MTNFTLDQKLGQMKRNKQRKGEYKNPAFTLTELLVVMAVAALLVVFAMPALGIGKAKALRMNCASNLKQISQAFRIWGGNYSNQFPAHLLGSPYLPNTTSLNYRSGNGSGIEPQTWESFAVMSNELNNTKVMVCPTDQRFAPTNFTTDLGIGPGSSKNSRCSYFVGRDANEFSPQMLLAGDRNIGSDTTQAMSLNPGPASYSPFGSAVVASQGYGVALGTNLAAAPLNGPNFGWNLSLHQTVGNVALVDGSVLQLTSSGLKQALAFSGDTNGYNYLSFP